MAATVKVITKPSRTLAEQAYIPAIAEGLRLTMGRFFKNTFSSREEGEIVTLMYPEETEAYPERFRGIHRLTQRADGSPRCVACLCCSTACPAQCIHIEAGEYPEGDKRRGYERFPVRFVIVTQLGIAVLAAHGGQPRARAPRASPRRVPDCCGPWEAPPWGGRPAAPPPR